MLFFHGLFLTSEVSAECFISFRVCFCFGAAAAAAALNMNLRVCLWEFSWGRWWQKQQCSSTFRPGDETHERAVTSSSSRYASVCVKADTHRNLPLFYLVGLKLPQFRSYIIFCSPLCVLPHFQAGLTWQREVGKKISTVLLSNVTYHFGGFNRIKYNFIVHQGEK